MLFSTSQLHPNSRVWIYQANRKLKSNEIQIIEDYLLKAIEDWSAHGAALKAGYNIRFNQIICLFADEQDHAASGCSIDASTRWFKELGIQLDIDFFDRSAAIIKEQELQLIPFLSIKKAVEDGVISSESLIATPQVPNLAFYTTQWPEKASNSWLKKYLKQEIV